jgi:predicted O-methyltransferase YrrM
MTTINDYVACLYAEKDDLTRNQFVQATQLKDFTPVVDDDAARFLKVLLHTVRPRHVLEIGTGIGYSTTRMASIIKDYQGKIITVQSDEKVA